MADIDHGALLAAAREVRKNAYVPYTSKAAGAALLDKAGKIYSGCTFENVNYLSSICAGKTAFMNAVSEGSREFVAIAVVGEGADTPYLCGDCRQTLVEINPDMVVISEQQPAAELALRDLLPYAFSFNKTVAKKDTPILPFDSSTLVEAARQVREHAYAPYSNYRVGAALLTRDGSVFTGCNVENTTLRTGMCAEQVAITNAISDGHQEFVAIAVVTENGGTPCGFCRQVMVEFAPDMIVLIADPDGILAQYTVSELLPYSYRVAHK